VAGGVRVVIDLGMQEMMNGAELKSLAGGSLRTRTRPTLNLLLLLLLLLLSTRICLSIHPEGKFRGRAPISVGVRVLNDPAG